MKIIVVKGGKMAKKKAGKAAKKKKL